MKGFLNSGAISECLNDSSSVFKSVWALELKESSAPPGLCWEPIRRLCLCWALQIWRESPLHKAADTQTNCGAGCFGSRWIQVTEENVELV